MGWTAGRSGILAALLVLAGLVIFARSLRGVVRSIRARFTYGAPYRRGTIADRLLGLAMTLPVLFLGLGLLFLAWGQSSFQRSDAGTVRVARVEARRSGWGKVTVRIVPDPLYPAAHLLEGEVSGARWAVAGDFISWSRDLKWLGLTDGHRVRYLFGTRDTTGTSTGSGEERTRLESPPPSAALLMKAARYLPFLTVRIQASPWFPLAERQIMTLYVIGPGYLADIVAEAPAR
jgi:hypothetical protein